MKSISEAREDIEAIDAQIVRLLAQRQDCAKIIGENKAREGKNVVVPEREEELLRKLEKLAAELAIPHANIRGIYREIISASVALQMRRPIAYLGPEGTFTHQAARKNFGGGVELLPKRTLAEVFESVARDKCAYGVVPVENTNAGAVTGTLDMLAETDLKIVAQILLPIEQCLVCAGTLDGVRRVLSKDIALEQCSEWLMHHLPQADLVPTDSTAAAVECAAKDPSVAAVASAIAAEMRGVPVLEHAVQNPGVNVTRFLVIGKKTNPPCTLCEEKTSIVIFVKNTPGSLQRALEPFSKRSLNIARIESRPARARAWEYMFFIDFIGSWENENVRAAIAELEENAVYVKHLGSYPNT
ncbi:prephenate dehydratase [Candidatus Spyradosoma sp. SGI.093]|uniref:prephenate dehydratase n=1 Tax=Candidatus Spyradosoma sp. SGI.093 TaxID=3420583 RepID=UPI003D05BF87